MYTERDHTFVVCAYKESAYLEDAIRSLIHQTVKSRIIVSTSTPNAWIESLCEKYGLLLVVNRGESSIAKDWNFGYDAAETPLVTIAHQDDIYEPKFLERTLHALNRGTGENVQIVFTDYCELRAGKKVCRNKLLTVKRILLFPLRIRSLGKIPFVKGRVLSFGNPICCPSVTLVKENLGASAFDERYVNGCDYKTWAGLANKEGMFLYVPEKLMAHRIHAESATTKNVADGTRKQEDLQIMCEFWPRWVAKQIHRLYVKGEKSNMV